MAILRPNVNRLHAACQGDGNGESQSEQDLPPLAEKTVQYPAEHSSLYLDSAWQPDSDLLDNDTETDEVNNVRNQRLANRLVWIACD